MLSALSVPRAFAQRLAGRETCRLLGARWWSFTSTSRNLWAAVVLVSSHESSGVWVRARPDVEPRRDSGHSPSSPCSAWCFVPGGAHPMEEPQWQSPTRTLLWSKDGPALRSLPGVLAAGCSEKTQTVSLGKTGDLGEAILENICFLMSRDVFDYLYINICLTNIAYLERCIYVHISLMVQTWILFLFFLIKCERTCTKI